MSMPFNKVKDEKVFKIKLDDKDYVVEFGKHFSKPWIYDLCISDKIY